MLVGAARSVAADVPWPDPAVACATLLGDDHSTVPAVSRTDTTKNE